MADSIITADSATGPGGTLQPHYGTPAGGTTYFECRVRSDPWDDATLVEQTAALKEATFLMDRLNYKGCKTDPDQELQFPRNEDITVPLDIDRAAYEIAIRILDGVDPELEAEDFGVKDQSYDTVRTSFERSFVQEHMLANIPSVRAWGYLKPYLRDPRTIHFSRIN